MAVVVVMADVRAATTVLKAVKGASEVSRETAPTRVLKDETAVPGVRYPCPLTHDELTICDDESVRACVGVVGVPMRAGEDRGAAPVTCETV